MKPNTTRWMRVALVSAGLLLLPPPHARGADAESTLEQDAKTIDSAAATPAGQERVAARLADDLNKSCKCNDYTSASVTADRATVRGWGGALIGNVLAQAIAQKQGLTLTVARDQVFAARQASPPMGWGAIAKAYDLKMGPLVSSVEKSTKAMEKDQQVAEKAAKAADKAAKAADKAEGKADKAEAGAGKGGGAGGGGGGNGGGNGGGGGGGGGGGKGK